MPRALTETGDVSRGRFDARETMKRAVRAVLVLGAGYLALGLLADAVATRLPVSWEARLAAGVPWGVGVEHGEAARVQRTLERLVGAGHVRSLPYRTFVLDVDAANALAVPGGAIGVTRGLLESTEGEPGLAMVLAHELGHHHLRHTVRRLGRVLLLHVPLALVLGEQASALSGLTLWLAEAKYSRDQEREADDFGLRRVHAAYGDTAGALEFFEHVQREVEGGKGRWLRLAGTHPPTADRIAALRALAAELRSGGGEVPR